MLKYSNLKDLSRDAASNGSISSSKEVEERNSEILSYLEDEEELEAVAGTAIIDGDNLQSTKNDAVGEVNTDYYVDEEQESSHKGEIRRREQARTKELQKINKKKMQVMLESQNAAIEAGMNKKGRGRLKNPLQQTEISAHFAQVSQSSTDKKNSGRLFDGTRLRPRRKPFADLTNVPSLRLSTAANHVKLKPSPKVSPEHSSSKSFVSSAGSSDPKNSDDCDSPNSTAVAKGSLSSVLGVVIVKKGTAASKRGGRSTVNLEYVKEKSQNVSCTAAFSCPPVRRTHELRNDLMMKHDMEQNAACSEPCQKKKKRQRCYGPNDSRFVDQGIPLQDFIQKQRAYFAEVDSFELPEEVVSESELE